MSHHPISMYICCFVVCLFFFCGLANYSQLIFRTPHKPWHATIRIKYHACELLALSSTLEEITMENEKRRTGVIVPCFYCYSFSLEMFNVVCCSGAGVHTAFCLQRNLHFLVSFAFVYIRYTMFCNVVTLRILDRVR